MSTPAVQFDSVTYRYPGAELPAVQGVSLSVPPGSRLGILGPNGGGKSTLLRLALGLLTPQQGTVSVLGMTPDRARRAGLIGYVPQRSQAEANMPLSVRQVVTLGAAWRTPPWLGVGRAVRERVSEMLELVGAAALSERPIGKLSGGQLQRVLIARALASGAKVLALDEPTVGIDVSGQRLFAELLTRVHAQLGVTILVISHDLRAIAAGSDSVACLSRKLHIHTSPQGLTPQVLAEVFSHDLAAVAGVTGGVHVHAHRADECCPPSAPGDVTLTVQGRTTGNTGDAGRRDGGAA